jgi:CO/xanthine dehydrogenase Mo-binding subunit
MTGRGKFTDDMTAESAHCAFACAQYAHARIVKIDTTAARKCLA